MSLAFTIFASHHVARLSPTLSPPPSFHPTLPSSYPPLPPSVTPSLPDSLPPSASCCSLPRHPHSLTRNLPGPALLPARRFGPLLLARQHSTPGQRLRPGTPLCARIRTPGPALRPGHNRVLSSLGDVKRFGLGLLDPQRSGGRCFVRTRHAGGRQENGRKAVRHGGKEGRMSGEA